MGGSRRAIRSFHLRLHSSLRQQGGVFDAGCFMARRPKAKALGYQPCPFEGYAYVESWGGTAGEGLGGTWRWAGAVALCAMPTHDDGTVMNGAPGFVAMMNCLEEEFEG